ncbi:MAG: SelT/SelW/SelH family protein [Candidatus Methylopumilus sp.]|nr:SelT/SelW/SelH family protein [Candidatus Methylopumilus sp.]
MGTKPKTHQIEIQFCTQCGWLSRASWMMQEILTTFQDEILSVTLMPTSGGVFEIFLNKEKIYSRSDFGGFLDIKDIKKLIRDKINPERNLGHTDL